MTRQWILATVSRVVIALSIATAGEPATAYGFAPQLELLPTRKLGVAATAALDGANGVVERLAEYTLRLMIAIQDGKPLLSYHTTVPLDPQRIDEYGWDRHLRICLETN